MQDLTPQEFKAKLVDFTQIIGIDYGVKRIGVAVSDLMLLTATPLKIVANLNELETLIKDRNIGGFVVGLPKLMSGEEGTQAQITRKWVSLLEGKFQKPVLFWDERLSSSAVSRIIVEQADLSRKRQKEVIDKLAASYILQGALDLLRSL